MNNYVATSLTQHQVLNVVSVIILFGGLIFLAFGYLTKDGLSRVMTRSMATGMFVSVAICEFVNYAIK